MQMTHLSVQRVKATGASPTLRTNIILEEEIFTAVDGTSIRSGKSKIPLPQIAASTHRFYFTRCLLEIHLSLDLKSHL